MLESERGQNHHAGLSGSGDLVGFFCFGVEARAGLVVATFEKRAIRVYERAGFRRVETFTSNEGVSFPMMVRRV